MFHPSRQSSTPHHPKRLSKCVLRQETQIVMQDIIRRSLATRARAVAVTDTHQAVRVSPRGLFPFRILKSSRLFASNSSGVCFLTF